MPIAEPEFAQSHDPRLASQLAEHATGASPAWLWSADGSRILWANAVGAAIFGAANISECATRRFDLHHPAAVEVTRLAATLPPAGRARLDRLRGFGASFGRALTCICSRFALVDGAAAILVVATEPAGPTLTLRERVSRMFPDCERMLAVFASDGTLLHATVTARTRFAGTPTLVTLGIGAVAAEALVAGSAGGTTDYGPVSVHRLGGDASAVLVVTFNGQSSGTRTNESAPAEIEPGPAGAIRQAGIEALTLARSAERAATADAPPAMQASHGPVHEEPIAERRHPLRFVWQMDADGRFVVGSDEFIELIGPRTTAAFGRLWSEIAAELKLDPENQVARAVATRETWSGITVSWPVDDGEERLPVELSGLPIFDRERGFRGYRGFGICRDVGRINELTRARRERPVESMARLAAPADGDGASAAMPQRESFAGTEAAAILPPAAEAAAEVALSSERPTPSVAAAAANVLLFRPATPEPKEPSLSPVERTAFRELAQELTARLRGGREAAAVESAAGGLATDEHAISIKLAVSTLASSGPEAMPKAAGEAEGGAVRATAAEVHEPQFQGGEAGSQREEPAAAQQQALPVFESVLLDRIPVGVLIYRHDSLLYANKYFLELSGYPNLAALAAAGGLDTLFAAPGDVFGQDGGAQSVWVMTRDGDRRPVEGRLFNIPWGGASALALILPTADADERRRTTAPSLGTPESGRCELTAKPASLEEGEQEPRVATTEAQNAAAKADFVNKVSHQIRTPLNTITGFTEVIMAERFGPIGNERYREYLKDMHAAEIYLVSLLNELLDLSKIETGQLDLTFANVGLNDLTQQCVGIMQPQASRARIIIRTSLTPGLPKVVADERSLRQIVLNLLAHSIKFTGPGGQVIVSTALADSGEVILRVRDTGFGMSEKDVEAALEPFRQTATSGSWGSGATGLGLPLTKALAVANRAHFSIKSAPNAGTLIEVTFPPTRVVAQ